MFIKLKYELVGDYYIIGGSGSHCETTRFRGTRPQVLLAMAGRVLIFQKLSFTFSAI